MGSPLYRRLFPNTRIIRDSQFEFATTCGGFRLSVSVGGTLTGRGGNIAIIDDPMKAQDSYSASTRESVRQWFSHTLLSRLDNKLSDAIVVVMQRLHVDDLVGHLLQEGDWTVLNLPAIAEFEQDFPLGWGACIAARSASCCIQSASRNRSWMNLSARWDRWLSLLSTSSNRSLKKGI